MTRRPLPFRQADVERAVKAALSAGLVVGTVEVTQSGTIRVITSGGEGESAPQLPFDEWKEKNNASAP